VVSLALATVFLAWTPGSGIQQTMLALKNGRPVKILYYGQSITAQSWTEQVTSDLRKRFPKATITAENRAIGGFAADKLRKALQSDVTQSWPDLVIFHDYGGNDTYDPLIEWMRTNTSAEVLIQSDHISDNPDAAMKWHDQREGELQSLAQTWGAGFVNVRTQWRDTLTRTGRAAKEFLSDGVHLNDSGNALMARIVGDALVVLPDAITKPRVRTVRSNAVTVNDSVKVEVRTSKPVKIKNGRPGVYVTKSTGAGEIPLLKTATAGPTAVPETWTVSITEVRPSGQFSFTLRGSVTGEDGGGDSEKMFTSKSGRLGILPEDWEGSYMKSILGDGFKPGLAVTMKTIKATSEVVPADNEWHTVSLWRYSGRLESSSSVEWRIWQAGSKTINIR